MTARIKRLASNLRPTGVRRLVLAGAVAATATALASVFIAAEAMYLSGNERNFMLVVIAAAFVLAVVVANLVSRPLVEDLDRLAGAARRVADGDLGARAGVSRLDEVGSTADSFDHMVARLELTELRRTAEEAERRLLIASVGHDLRTPLAAIRAAVEAIEDGVATDQARYLRAVRTEVDHLTRLVDDLFLLAQIDAGRFEAGRDHVDLAELVDEAAEALLPTAASAAVGLEVTASGRAVVRGTAHDLGRVVRNLIDNAIRHAPAGGSVELIVESGDDGVTITVIDDGPGFEPGFVERALEPFSRADDSRNRSLGGAGLGLAIARGVVEAHGGMVAIADGPGGRVSIRIPND